MANPYYSTTGKNVANLDKSDETDINDINSAVETAFDLVDVDITALQGSGALSWAEVARKWAEEVEDTEVAAGQYSALHHSAKSADSAAAAAASAAVALGVESLAEVILLDLTAVPHINEVITVANTNLSIVQVAGGRTITNTGTVADINLVLPAGYPGAMLSLLVDEPFYIKVITSGVETIGYIDTTTAGPGYVRSNVVGTHWTLKWSGSVWQICELTGTLKGDV